MSAMGRKLPLRRTAGLSRTLHLFERNAPADTFGLAVSSASRTHHRPLPSREGRPVSARLSCICAVSACG